MKNFNANPLTVFIIIVSFLTLMFLTKPTHLLEVDRYNSENELQNTEELVKYQTTDLKQSFFGDIINSYNLQSTIPFEEEDLSIMRALIKNDINEPYHIRNVEIYKGTKLLYESRVDALLKPGEQYIYKSPGIDMETQEGVKQTIKIVFTVITYNTKQEIKIDYNYDYIQLTPCTSESDCSGNLAVCDLENVARFGSENKKYCVMPCISTANCYEGQVCIHNRCGY